METTNARHTIRLLLLLLSVFGCAQKQHSGMVIDPQTGLQYGSVVEQAFLFDAGQFENRKLKLRIRNTSGDLTFDLGDFRDELESSFEAKGFEIDKASEYGLLADINVAYSGSATTDMASKFGFLGAAIGGLTGVSVADNRTVGSIAGIIGGATLGSILGSYSTQNTYIVVTQVSFAAFDSVGGKKKTTVSFGSSKEETETRMSGFRPFREVFSTGVAVYAGGNNVSQQKISLGVTERLVRILADVF